MQFNINDNILMKKPHPCGSYEWQILRVGADFKIKCLKCGHIALISRTKFEKGFKKFL